MLGLLILLIAGPSHAQIRPILQTVLPLKVTFGDQIGTEWKAPALEAVQSALQIVAAFPPAHLKNHLFHWEGDRSALGNRKQFHIVLAVTDSEYAKNLGVNPLEDDPNERAETAPFKMDGKNGSLVVTTLYLDRIYFDAAGKSESNAYAHLVWTLGREIYGEVQRLLMTPTDPTLDDDVSDAMLMREKIEILSASAGFLQSLISSPRFASFASADQSVYREALQTENATVESWKHFLASIDAKCGEFLE